MEKRSETFGPVSGVSMYLWKVFIAMMEVMREPSEAG
jgi:hypothetical protein